MLERKVEKDTPGKRSSMYVHHKFYIEKEKE